MRTREHFFGGNREIAIQRDGERCVSCGLTRNEHRERYGRDITVDHIDGKGRYTPKPARNNSLDNLQTLCLSCHGKKDIKRVGKSSRRKLNPEQVTEIRQLIKQNITATAISKLFNVTPEAIMAIRSGRNWKEQS